MQLGATVFYALTEADRNELQARTWTAPPAGHYYRTGREFPAIVVGATGDANCVDLQIFTGPSSLFRRGVWMGRMNGQFHP